MEERNALPCAVLGAGSFGTSLALLLAERGYAVDLWARDPKLAEAIQKHRRNPRYLTEFQLPENIRATASLEEALEDKELVLSVMPSHGVREVWTRGASMIRRDALVITVPALGAHFQARGVRYAPKPSIATRNVTHTLCARRTIGPGAFLRTTIQ